jgi:hypothetical protein
MEEPEDGRTRCCKTKTHFKRLSVFACSFGTNVRLTGWAGIAQSVWAGRSGDRIPVGARFSAPVQTGPGAHIASYIMGTGSLSRG